MSKTKDIRSSKGKMAARAQTGRFVDVNSDIPSSKTKSVVTVKGGSVVRDTKTGRFMEVTRNTASGKTTSKARAKSVSHSETVSIRRGAALQRLLNR